MNRRSLIKKLTSLLGLCFTPKLARAEESEIEQLELDYCRSMNELNRYREDHGFVPGARVEAIDYGPMTGVIPPYGDAWRVRGPGLCIPVNCDAGYLQPWQMSHLRIMQPPK